VRYFFALLCYRLLFLLLMPLVLIFIILRSRNNSAYRQRLIERFGLLPKVLKPNGIVVHAASVGEVIALKSYIDQLLAESMLNEQDHLPITLTTFTPTGSAQVKKLFGDKVQHCYLPFDNVISTSLFLAKLKPQAMVFMETELWPNLIAQCHHQQIKLMLINARLSTKSVNSYQKLSWLIKPTLNHFNKVLCQSQVNYNNFIQLGRNSNDCEVSGNLKFDISLSEELHAKQEKLKQVLATKRPVWIVASTHPGDETLALKAFEQLKASIAELLLIIVPRHPERFDEVAKLCLSKSFKLARRSRQDIVQADTDIFLLDSLGELLPTYAFATVVTMGGSFSKVGGHNPLEPALYKKPVVVGNNMSNFSEVLTQLHQNDAIVQLAEEEIAKSNNDSNVADNLAMQVLTILNSAERQKTLGENAFQVVKQNQGASIRSVKQLKLLLE